MRMRMSGFCSQCVTLSGQLIVCCSHIPRDGGCCGGATSRLEMRLPTRGQWLWVPWRPSLEIRTAPQHHRNLCLRLRPCARCCLSFQTVVELGESHSDPAQWSCTEVRMIRMIIHKSTPDMFQNQQQCPFNPGVLCGAWQPLWELSAC